MIALHADIIRLGDRIVLRDMAFTARAELAVIAGPNGAGKTTLLRALAGLLPGFPAPDPRRVAYLPQGARAAWALTVEQVAMLGRLPHRDAAAAPVARALAACGIAELRHRRIDRVSGGQARRAMLARVFATEPETLLLDEPTADLDPRAAHAMMSLLRRAAEAGRTIIVVSHDVDLALAHAHRIVVLSEGRIAADAAPEAALPALAAAFGMGWGVSPSPRLLPPDAP